MIAVVLLGCGLAYQLPFDLRLAIGGDPVERRREDDAPFLRMAHASEPAVASGANWWELPGGNDPYRWTQPVSQLQWPGIGGGSWLVTLRAQGGRPDGSETITRWKAGSLAPITLSLPAAPARLYTILAPANGTLLVVMETAPLLVADDPRPLGFVLRDARARSVGGWRAPDWGQLGWIGLTLIAAWGWGHAVALPVRWRQALIVALGGTAIVAIGVARPAIALLTPMLAALVGAATAINLALAWRWPQQRAFTQAVGLTLVAIVIRLAGLLHPHTLSSDAGFHANNLLRLGLGQALLTAGLPADAGGGTAPYPAGFYLIALPFQALVSDDFATRRLLMTVITAVLDSLFCLFIWWLVTRAGFSQRAALLSAATYLAPSQPLEALTIGEFANVGGQALILPALIALSSGVAAASSSPLLITGLALAIAAGLMAHSGVTIAFGLMIGWAWLLAWTQPRQLADPIKLLIAAVGGGAFALAILYTTPLYVELITARAGQGRSGGLPFGQILAETALALGGLQPPHRRALIIPPGLTLASFAGLWLLWRASPPAADRLRWLLGAWWGSALTSLALLLVADQGVRWALFLYPALCLPAGIALDRLARHRAGRIAVAVWLTAIIGQGMWLWVTHLRDYLH